MSVHGNLRLCNDLGILSAPVAGMRYRLPSRLPRLDSTLGDIIARGEWGGDQRSRASALKREVLMQSETTSDVKEET
jgi:hypothetical protein